MYTPPPDILEKYADVLVSFALNSGKGMKKNDVVYIVSQLPGLPLAKEVCRAVVRKGGHPLLNLIEDDFKLIQLQSATDRQLSFFPEKYYRGLADTIDHWVRILADRDPLFLRDIEPGKIMRANRAAKPFRDWLDEKEDQNRFTWTLCLYGTEGLAREAGMSLREYWGQIRRACFLDKEDPVTHWRKVFDHMQRILSTLNALPIERLHVQAPKTDLWITLGKKRRWLGGSGRNIPSFEIFTSPDWRGTEGKIFFDLPLYRYGNIIRDISLEFRKGRVVKASARTNGKFLQEMVGQKNADKIGEFSLTDRRFSRINKFMADTLYDENYGGSFGNTHLAVGKSYHDTYDGDPRSLTEKQFEEMGFNHSPEHTDIIATTDRTVTAVLKDGSERVIYRQGEFVL